MMELILYIEEENVKGNELIKMELGEVIGDVESVIGVDIRFLL